MSQEFQGKYSFPYAFFSQLLLTSECGKSFSHHLIESLRTTASR